jgi:hypothetical protein
MGDNMALSTAIESIDDAITKIRAVKMRLTGSVIIDKNYSTMDEFRDSLEQIIQHLNLLKEDLNSNETTINNTKSELGL